MSTHTMLAVCLAACAVGITSGCVHAVTDPREGGGVTKFEGPRRLDPRDVAVPAGYRIEVVASNLTFPTALAFDGAGRLHVTEAGYSYGGVVTTPRLLRIEPDGSHTEIARGENPPWNGLTYHEGAFYVGGGHLEPGGQILRIGADGAVSDVVSGLPAIGDHFVSGPIASADGWLYFSVGTNTNSGVVGLDNFDHGWPRRFPDGHDIPCRDVVLTGRNYVTPNPFTPEEDDEAVTGAFMPFGVASQPGQVVPGAVPCSGAILRSRPEGGALELVAWGFRNTWGMAFGPDGALYVTENQYDVRGSRPVFGAGDLLWRVEPGRWYGWPDYWANLPLTREGWFEPPEKSKPERLLATHPGEPPEPVARLAVHASANGLAFSRSTRFGHVGDAFIAEFGDLVPTTGETFAPVGYKVVRVEPSTGIIHDFAVNVGETNGPASWLGAQGLERPMALAFDPSGEHLYVVDFGVLTTREGIMRPRTRTGVVWRITRGPS